MMKMTLPLRPGTQSYSWAVFLIKNIIDIQFLKKSDPTVRLGTRPKRERHFHRTVAAVLERICARLAWGA